VIALVGPFSPSLQGSELEKLRGGLANELPPFDLGAVRETLALVREAVRAGVVRSAHDVSDGGLACCLAESAIFGGVGAAVDLDPLLRREGVEPEEALFGEGPGGIVVSGPRDALLELSRQATKVGFLALGRVGGENIRIVAADARIDLSVEAAGGLFDPGLTDKVS
jgi:phosphoribosylformylglycinamidine synthase